MHIYTYIYKYVHAYIHIYIHTYIHTYYDTPTFDKTCAYVCYNVHCAYTMYIAHRERVLLVGTQFSILYTSMYSPAEAATLKINNQHTLIYNVYCAYVMYAHMYIVLNVQYVY